MDCLKRNLFLDTMPNEEHVKIIANYMVREIESASKWSITDIDTNNISFGDILEAEV